MNSAQSPHNVSADCTPHVYGAVDFGRLLRKEHHQRRTSGDGFCVVQFEPDGQTSNSLDSDLLNALHAHTDPSDAIASFGEGRFALLLRSPNAERARQIVNTVRKTCDHKESHIDGQIFHFRCQRNGRPKQPANSPTVTESPDRSRDSATELSDSCPGDSTSGRLLESAVLLNPIPLWKRTLDIVGATLALLILSPVFLLVGLVIRCSSRGPVFFRHRRFGYLGEPFHVWKFRTMHHNADTRQHQQHVQQLMQGENELKKLTNEAQFIPVGKWLRSSAIDELPQLLNVILGEMSLVGPRPDVISVDQFSPEQRMRFSVLPGITGLWQVSGKNKTTFAEMVALDIRYIENRSFWLDVKIILLTAPTIFMLVREDLWHK